MPSPDAVNLGLASTGMTGCVQQNAHEEDEHRMEHDLHPGTRKQGSGKCNAALKISRYRRFQQDALLGQWTHGSLK
eukprot:4180185-Amphidinium_carterae.1